MLAVDVARKPIYVPANSQQVVSESTSPAGTYPKTADQTKDPVVRRSSA